MKKVSQGANSNPPILLVLLVMGIVSFFALSYIRELQAKTRDEKRKSDLSQIQKELEIYHSTHGKYPGVIEKMPSDPVHQLKYSYRSSKDGSKYQLFAKLENKKDPEVVLGLDSDCGVACNYGLTSANLEVGGKLDE
ncbi:MAG: hypothetical protein HYU80_03465 [Candidatus Blackburnbacteria bacterium]|nr:hypothetical protein [Candidatus Blackburnbacteria bacterium]